MKIWLLEKGNRILAVLLMVLLSVSVCACAKKAEVEPTPTVEVTQTPTPTPTATPTPTPIPTDTPVPEYVPMDVPEQDGLYKLVVYFGTQSVVAYEAQNGQWTEIRRMICSTGKVTPEGTFRVNNKYEYHSLFGARGQYCCRIKGTILFHSVPIDPDAKTWEIGKRSMMMEEYEKLGTRASDGCVRLTCEDAKWIYDNCDKTTAVVMTEADGPIPTKPPELIYEEPYMTADGLGWDPTDPDPENPYLAK